MAVQLHSCTTPKHSPSPFGFSCFLICKIIVLNKLCDGVLWKQLMGAYRVHLFPTHVQWPHLGSFTSAMVGVFTPKKLANTINQSFPPTEGWLLNTYKHTPGLNWWTFEVYSKSNNIQLWDCFSTTMLYSNAIELAFLFLLYHLPDQAVWAILIFMLGVTPKILLSFIYFCLDIFIPVICLDQAFNIKCLFTVCFFFLSEIVLAI